MKVEKQKQFSPITITLETQEEKDQFIRMLFSLNLGHYDSTSNGYQAYLISQISKL